MKRLISASAVLALTIVFATQGGHAQTYAQEAELGCKQSGIRYVGSIAPGRICFTVTSNGTRIRELSWTMPRLRAKCSAGSVELSDSGWWHDFGEGGPIVSNASFKYASSEMAFSGSLMGSNASGTLQWGWTDSMNGIRCDTDGLRWSARKSGGTTKPAPTKPAPTKKNAVTSGNDTLRGTAKADWITGKGGDDSIFGGAGNDRLDGGAGNDRINGQAGNDKLHGGEGNDVLVGGSGNDLLVGGAGADTLQCGPGRDTAQADAKDNVAKDCEVVKGIPKPQPLPPLEPPPPTQPPPPPQTPPSAPVTAGSYKGLLEGNFIFFDVLPSQDLTGFRTNHIRETCNNAGAWVMDWPLSLLGTVHIRDDGSFQVSGRGDTTVSNVPAKYVYELAGKFSGTTATGTISMSHEWDQEGFHWICTSGQLSWTASLVP